MPRPRFARLEEGKKQALLKAAEREFAARDYESASINRILEESGFSKGSFYHYFDDKADLASFMLLRAYEKPLAIVRDVKTPASAAEFWAELARTQALSIEALEADRTAYEMIIRLSNEVLKNPSFSSLIMPAIGETMVRIKALWQLGQTLGAVRTDLTVEVLMGLVEAVKRSTWQAQFPPQHIPTHDEIVGFVAQMLNLVKRMCLPVTQLSELPK